MYLEKFKLDGRIAVVTGAARGIGLAIAEALAEAGATVVLTDMDLPALEAAVAGLSAKGHRVEGERLDVADPAAVKHVQKLDRRPARQGRHPRQQCGDRDLEPSGRSHVGRGVEQGDRRQPERCLLVLPAFGAGMLDRGSGTIVNVGSMSGFIVNRPQEQAKLQCVESRGPSPDEVAGCRMGRPRRAGQCGGPPPISRPR